MTPSLNLIKLVEAEEGLVLHPYHDETGLPTIGWGTTRYPGGKSVQMGDPAITVAEATTYLMNDVTDTVTVVNNQTVKKGVILTQNQFDALIDLVYNIGGPRFLTSTVLRLIRVNPSDPKITAAFLMWDKDHQEGALVTSPTLLQRRRKEAKLYFTP